MACSDIVCHFDIFKCQEGGHICYIFALPNNFIVYLRIYCYRFSQTPLHGACWIQLMIIVISWKFRLGWKETFWLQFFLELDNGQVREDTREGIQVTETGNMRYTSSIM